MLSPSNTSYHSIAAGTAAHRSLEEVHIRGVSLPRAAQVLSGTCLPQVTLELSALGPMLSSPGISGLRVGLKTRVDAEVRSPKEDLLAIKPWGWS